MTTKACTLQSNLFTLFLEWRRWGVNEKNWKRGGGSYWRSTKSKNSFVVHCKFSYRNFVLQQGEFITSSIIEIEIKGNFDFGISRIMKSLDNFQRKLDTDTWFYAKLCFLALAEALSKHMMMLKDSVYFCKLFHFS